MATVCLVPEDKKDIQTGQLLTANIINAIDTGALLIAKEKNNIITGGLIPAKIKNGLKPLGICTW